MRHNFCNILLWVGRYGKVNDTITWAACVLWKDVRNWVWLPLPSSFQLRSPLGLSSTWVPATHRRAGDTVLHSWLRSHIPLAVVETANDDFSMCHSENAKERYILKTKGNI